MHEQTKQNVTRKLFMFERFSQVNCALTAFYIFYQRNELKILIYKTNCYKKTIYVRNYFTRKQLAETFQFQRFMLVNRQWLRTLKNRHS